MGLDIVWLVRTTWIIVWIVSVLPWLIASIPSSKLNSFRELVSSFTARGKILQSTSQMFDYIDAEVYSSSEILCSLLCYWSGVLLATTWNYGFKMASLSSKEFQLSDIASRLTGGFHVFSFQKSHMTTIEDRFRVWRAVFLLLLLEIQVLRRLIESIYVFKYSPSARLHIFSYLGGIFLSLCSTIASEVARFAGNQLAEFIANGKSHTSAPEFNLLMSISPLMKQLGSLQWIDGAIFLWGWIHQRPCHKILGSLRESPSQAKEYIIPYGDWFEMVSCPHYFAEIVLYLGLLIASGGTDITIWLPYGFVVANLTYAAGETHCWYHRKFENYPANRQAIFPFVY